VITFFVALLCFCLVVSNPWTRIIVGMTSALLVVLIVLGLQTAYIGSRRAWKVWMHGLLPSLVGPLQCVRGSVEHLVLFVLGVVELLRNRLVSRGQGGAGSV
jgi:hypothetical protein